MIKGHPKLRERKGRLAGALPVGASRQPNVPDSHRKETDLRESLMKKCCKNVDILSDDFIENATYEALDEKWKRSDVAKYFTGCTIYMSLKQMKNLLRDPENRNIMVSGLIRTSSENIRYEIENRCLTTEPIKYDVRPDGMSGKLREIGVECVKQLILDEIASEGLDELWRRKLGYHQYASIKGKGQLGGKKAIEKQIRKHYMQSRWAWKGDIRHCYQSIDLRRLKRMLERDVKNVVLLYLVFFLIGTYKQGLNIGSGLSQFLCNYYLVKAYDYVLGLHKTRKHRDGTTESKKLVYFCLFYMDDILLIGSREADVKRAARALEKFLLKEYGLIIKPDWDLFLIDYMIRTGENYMSYQEKDKAERRGKPIDMMGWVIYREHTEIRAKIFLRARRAYSTAWICMKTGTEIPLKVAQRCASYYGWFKHTDSKHAKEKYNINQVFNAAKRRISEDGKSKIHGPAAKRALATCE